LKNIIMILLLVLVAGALFDCHNLSLAQEQKLQPMQQSYRGYLPCEACTAEDASLFLLTDGTYILTHNQPLHTTIQASFGSWARTADKLVLSSVQGDKLYFRPEGDNLLLLDIHGVPSEQLATYQLKPVQQLLPTIPMSLKGMYQYQADAAIFTDCATGKQFPVSLTQSMEKQYLAVRQHPSQLIFVSLDGHFTIEPSMEEGKQHKALVPDGQVKFDIDKRCPQ
jgi:copper homeostasis protein (lipoprotein)